MAKLCDNTSVGQIIEISDLELGAQLVMIDRHNYPEAKAFPAGHEDGVPGDEGVRKEVGEEVGLTLLSNRLVWEGRIDNPCKREGGTHHAWKVYYSTVVAGDLKAGSDAKRAMFVSKSQLREFAKRTEYFMEKYKISHDDVGRLTVAIFGDPARKNTDPEWKENPGLEPVWYYILRQLNYFDWTPPVVQSATTFPAKKRS